MRILLIVALCLFASASGADQKADEAIQQERAKEERERYRAAVKVSPSSTKKKAWRPWRSASRISPHACGSPC